MLQEIYETFQYFSHNRINETIVITDYKKTQRITLYIGYKHEWKIVLTLNRLKLNKMKYSQVCPYVHLIKELSIMTFINI